MGKYFDGIVGVSVKVFEAKNAVQKQTEKGGVFQMIGQCAATIEINGEVVFERLSGMIGVNYRDMDAFHSGQGNFFISYANAYKTENGKQYDKVQLSDKMTDILQVETLMAFNSGFATPEHDEETASNAEMKAEDYISLAKAAMNKAAGLKKDISSTVSLTAKQELNALDAELAKEIG